MQNSLKAPGGIDENPVQFFAGSMWWVGTKQPAERQKGRPPASSKHERQRAAASNELRKPVRNHTESVLTRVSRGECVV